MLLYMIFYDYRVSLPWNELGVFTLQFYFYIMCYGCFVCLPSMHMHYPWRLEEGIGSS